MSIAIRIPRRTGYDDVVFVDSISRFVHSGRIRVVSGKIGCIVTSLLKIVKQCTRKYLKLNYGSSNCVFGGCLQYEEIDVHGKTHVTYCSGMLRSYRLHLDHIQSVQTAKSCPADFILIVEKLVVLESLIEEKFCHTFPCVLVTGCGQPDVQCRMFVKMLHDALRIPICVLVDFNAYGIKIMRSYKVVSFSLAYENYR
ncbi:meiotic recombination protein SPO11-1-like [Spinacia oleracea]|uniref:Meiotic recombination protein SPO11-1-like n=1 Tax=Spinacia oleracea TaxID=3562 RepID=A0ABM3QQ42_SPIOL|nr:meiotic recombination protein SPO11-1-like [Spinacia oleracea]